METVRKVAFFNDNEYIDLIEEEIIPQILAIIENSNISRKDAEKIPIHLANALKYHNEQFLYSTKFFVSKEEPE